ncbi:MAG: hypothetical protein ACR2JI_13780 [Mycobacterium sp.]
MAKHDAAAGDELTDADPPAHIDGEVDCATEIAADEHISAPRISSARTAMLVSALIAVAAMALVGFLGFRTFESMQARDRDNLFVEVARQGAVNLTTINWQEADKDVNRILESATGAFYDDFEKRSQPFVEVVKQAQSQSVGTVTGAGLESSSDDQAQVLVAVSVKTTNRGAQEASPRAWRMRINVQKIGDQAKVSNVQFVP